MEGSTILIQDEAKDCPSLPDLDAVLDTMNGISKYQVASVFGAIILTFTSTCMTTLPFYLSATPQHRCWIPEVDEFESQTNMSDQAMLQSLIPQDENEIYDSCRRYVYNTSTCDGELCLSVSPELTECDRYYYNRSVYNESISTEWDLVCDRTILKSIASSIFFFGYFLGSVISGMLADWFGRRVTMLLITISISSFGIAVSLSPNYIFYLFAIALFTASTIGGYIVAYAYVGEISTRKRRKDMLLMTSLLSNVGDLIVAPIASALRHWRWLELVLCLIPVVFIPVYFYIGESPRWLLSVGRENEALKVVKKYFKSKRVELDYGKWTQVLEAERMKREIAQKREKYTVLDLFKPPHVRIMSSLIMISFFTASLVYYGLVLNIGNLAGDPYINSAINSCMDISAAACLFVLVRLQPKGRLLFGAFLLAGTGCLGSIVALQSDLPTLSVALACMGRFGAASAYKTAFLLTAEFYPTVIRGIGLSLGSSSSRIGSMVSPFTVDAQSKFPWLMQTIFGGMSILAGLLAIFYPDTNDVSLMSSIEETEQFCAENMHKLCRRRNVQETDSDLEKDALRSEEN